MRKFGPVMVLLVCVIFIMAVTVPCTAGDEYPKKPVVSVVPFGAGGGTDMAARVLSSVIGEYLGQPFVVVNKSGVSGTVGASYVAKAKPDGYTLGHLASTATLAECFTKYYKTDYTSDAFVPVAQWSGYPPLFVATASKPFSSMKELWAHAKTKDKVLFAGRGRGEAVSLILNMLCEQEGVNTIKNVPFKGDNKILAAVLGGHADFGVLTFSVAQPLIKSGKLKPLALVTDNKIPDFPDIPNLFELGYDTGIRQFYLGALVPKGTPADRVKKLEEAIEKATKNKSFVKMMGKINMPIIFRSGEELKKTIQKMKKTYLDLAAKGLM
jgi:tripartite-type tricarboxylate transporter receptor subunit TctC